MLKLSENLTLKDSKKIAVVENFSFNEQDFTEDKHAALYVLSSFGKKYGYYRWSIHHRLWIHHYLIPILTKIGRPDLLSIIKDYKIKEGK